MDTADLIELSDLNHAEALREMTRRAGGTAHDEGGVLLFAGGHDLPVLINGAMRIDTRVAPGEVIARARAFFTPRERGFSVILRAHADADLASACTDAGLTPFGNAPGMVLRERLGAATPPAGVTLEPVTRASDVADFATVMDAAYASIGMPAGVSGAQLPHLESLRAPHIVAVLARVDGAPAAGAMTIVTHGVAGIYWVGTTPSARGRGLAELCTRAAGNAGFDLGARIGALQASEMGEPVYRRMGYIEVTRYPTIVQLRS